MKSRERNIIFSNIYNRLYKFGEKSLLPFSASLFLDVILFSITESTVIKIIPPEIYHVVPALLFLAARTTETIAGAKLYQSKEKLYKQAPRAEKDRILKSVSPYVKGLEREDVSRKQTIYRYMEVIPATIFPPFGILNIASISLGARNHIINRQLIESQRKKG